MKNTIYIILALVALAVFVFWILPAALHLLIWAALLAGVAFIVYLVGRGVWRKKRARIAIGGQAKTERRTQRTAEKSLKEMERTLQSPTTSAKNEPLKK